MMHFIACLMLWTFSSNSPDFSELNSWLSESNLNTVEKVATLLNRHLSSLTLAELEQLACSENLTLSVFAAWEMAMMQSQRVNSGDGKVYQLTEVAVFKFRDALERAGVVCPIWWINAIRAGSRDPDEKKRFFTFERFGSSVAADIENNYQVFPLAEPTGDVKHREVVINNSLCPKIKVDRLYVGDTRNRWTLPLVDFRDARLPSEVDGVTGKLYGEVAFLLLLSRHIPSQSILLRFQAPGKTTWKSSTWSGIYGPDSIGSVRLEQNGKLGVFIISTMSAYVEVFDSQNGIPLLRFSSNYWYGDTLDEE